MKKILECKISLMEKDTNFSIDEKSKGNYIIRTTGTFEPEKYIMEWAFAQDMDQDQYLEFVNNAVLMIYDNLIENTKTSFDTVGLWITFDDGHTIDNAMDVDVMITMGEYGGEGVIPILEFAKMTLAPYYESEVGS